MIFKENSVLLHFKAKKLSPENDTLDHCMCTELINGVNAPLLNAEHHTNAQLFIMH